MGKTTPFWLLSLVAGAVAAAPPLRIIGHLVRHDVAARDEEIG